MTSHSIEKADNHDAAAIVDLIQRAYRGNESKKGWTSEADLIDGTRTTLAEIQAELDNPQTLILVATSATGDIIGCAGITYAGRSCEFGKFAVDPNQQANGIGKMLLEASEAAAKSHFGVSLMTMLVVDGRFELEAFYKRRGYSRTGKHLKMSEVNNRDDITFGHDLVLYEYVKALI